jgi:hypothetical protein
MSWVMNRAEEAAEAARSSAWSGVRSNPIMRLNELHVIGDTTLPQLYDGAVASYRRAVVDRATAWQVSVGMPPMTALATAMQEIPAKRYAGGLPAEASFLRQYATASRVPSIRRQLDGYQSPMAKDYGVELSPLEAIVELNRLSRPSRAASGDEWIYF